MSTDIIPFENKQQKQTLTAFLWIALISGTILGVIDLQFKTWESVIALFGMALVCIPLLILNA
jgi:hypothetical protein